LFLVISYSSLTSEQRRLYSSQRGNIGPLFSAGKPAKRNKMKISKLRLSILLILLVAAMTAPLVVQGQEPVTVPEPMSEVTPDKADSEDSAFLLLENICIDPFFLNTVDMYIRLTVPTSETWKYRYTEIILFGYNMNGTFQVKSTGKEKESSGDGFTEITWVIPAVGDGTVAPTTITGGVLQDFTTGEILRNVENGNFPLTYRPDEGWNCDRYYCYAPVVQ